MSASNTCPICSSPCQGNAGSIGGYELSYCATCQVRFCNRDLLTDVDYDAIYKTLEYKETQVDPIGRETDWRVFADISTYRPFFKNVPRIPSGKLLDIGCGVGRFCRAAFTYGWDVTGIDVSKTAIEAGSETAKFPMLNCTAEQMLERNQQFDCITAFEVLEHLDSPVELLKTVSALLRPGGTFFCTVPNWDSETVQKATRQDWIPPVHVNFFNETSLRALLQASMFGGVQSGVILGHTPPTLPGPQLLKYYLHRMIGKIGKPDPLGVWAVGQKS